MGSDGTHSERAVAIGVQFLARDDRRTRPSRRRSVLRLDGDGLCQQELR